MCMLLNRLVKRDSTRTAYSSDHTNYLILLLIIILAKTNDCNSSNLSNISLKKIIFSDKHNQVSRSNCKLSNVLRRLVKITNHH